MVLSFPYVICKNSFIPRCLFHFFVIANQCTIRFSFFSFFSTFALSFVVFTNKEIWKLKVTIAFSALTLLVRCQEEHLACKNWVMRCWCGCLSGARCDCLPMVLPFWYWLTQVVLEKRPLNGCSSDSCKVKATINSIKCVKYYCM